MPYRNPGERDSFEYPPLTYQLRDVVETDHPFLVELHNDPVVLRNLTHPEPITMAQHLEWWNRVSKDKSQLRRVFCIRDTPVGFTKFYDIDSTNMSVVLGADIHASWRGRGLAKIMWCMMLDLCFDAWGFHRVSLSTAAYNDVAQHVYRGLGFKEEGRYVQSLKRDGQYHDQILMYMLRQDWKGWP